MRRTRVRRSSSAAAAAGAACVFATVGIVSHANADPVDFHIVSNSVSVDRAKNSATFTLTFDQKPDFVAVDNGQPDAFQYEIDADSTSMGRTIGFNDVDAVVRGGEIFEGKGLPVRSPSGDGGSNSGGWGPVKALLPFQTSGDSVQFTTDLGTIGDNGDGQFRYRVFTTQNGTFTGQVVGAVIPLPAAVWTGLTMLGGIGVFRQIRRLPRIL